MKVAVFASGGGSNAAKIIEYFRDSKDVEVVLVACNNKSAGIWDIAKSNNIESIAITKENFKDSSSFLNELNIRNVDFVVLAGFLWMVPSYLVDAYPNGIVNIHPALLPRYGGKGMYGHHVHNAVHEAGEKESGMTIHYVNERYDEGDIIFQDKVKLDESDTPKIIAKKVLELEHKHFARVIESLLNK